MQKNALKGHLVKRSSAPEIFQLVKCVSMTCSINTLFEVVKFGQEYGMNE